jgi:septum formation protein
MKKLRIVLASSSERRREILSKLGFDFIIDPHRYKEPKIKNHPKPEVFVKKIAEQKVLSLKEKYKNAIIIGCDTIVVLNNEIIGKPKDVKEAEEILTKLSGTKHKVLSGLCLFFTNDKLILSDVEKSVVYTNKLTQQQIKTIAKKHLDKAGAYAVQEKNDMFVKRIVGDYYNVVGFPVKLFLKLYTKLITKILYK